MEMEEKPVRQQHDFYGHGRGRSPEDLPEQGQGDAGKHIHLYSPSHAQYKFPRPDHVSGIRGVAHNF